MTLRHAKIPTYKPRKGIEVNWNTFNGGWNNFSKPTELEPNELAEADNLMLVGKGTPTGRWGSDTYFLAGSGHVRLLDAFYRSTTSTNLLLAITDEGYFVKKNGASYTIITGASFPSGYDFQSVELGNTTFIAANTNNFIKFDGTNLIPYTGLSRPTNVSVAMLSSASGFNTWSWRVDAQSQTGRTLGSLSKTLASMPLDLTTTSVKVSWNTVSAAASVLTKYNIYRGLPGDETWIAAVGADSTEYIDTGTPQSDTLFPANVDETQGPKAKYILKFKDRIILAGIDGDPSRVLISARYPYQDRFTAGDGGGDTYVSPDDGDDITGLGIANLQTTRPLIVVYKEHSTHVIELGTVTLGNFVILDPKVYPLSVATGASNGKTVVQVENDMFSFGRKGLYSTGQEAQYLNQIRTNEISARIRPYIQSLSDIDFKEANAAYIDYKYILSFPSKKETIIFDRQRKAFMGPWKTPFGITRWLRYFDSSGTERWLAGCDDGYVREFSTGYISDSGTAVNKTMRTKKEDLGSWNMMKILNYFYFLLRNVRGSVTVSLRLEGRSGNTITAKTATITSSLGSGGWGDDQYGSQPWGQSEATVVLSGDELVRFAQIYKTFRVVQVEVNSSGANDNFEFLGIKMTAKSMGPSSLSSTLKV